MNKKDLRSAGVAFDSAPHTYTRTSDGKRLQGVTAMIQQLLFPDEYAAVDPDTLRAKAAWGTRQHREIQDMIVFGDAPATPSQKAFASLMKGAALTPIASEYTVSDGADFASNIDVVCSDGSLVDIKTVARLDRSKVSWQLSLYAMFFELTNPHLKADRLFAAWLPKNGEPRLVEVPRLSDKRLRALMKAWLEGLPYCDESPLDCRRIERAASLKLQIKRLTEAYDALAAEILQEMKAAGESSYSDELCTLSMRPPTVTMRFDAESFRKADPEGYSRYLRESATKETIAMRLRS